MNSFRRLSAAEFYVGVLVCCIACLWIAFFTGWNHLLSRCESIFKWVASICRMLVRNWDSGGQEIPSLVTSCCGYHYSVTIMPCDLGFAWEFDWPTLGSVFQLSGIRSQLPSFVVCLTCCVSCKACMSLVPLVFSHVYVRKLQHFCSISPQVSTCMKCIASPHSSRSEIDALESASLPDTTNSQQNRVRSVCLCTASVRGRRSML